jgi:hypothetical protein
MRKVYLVFVLCLVSAIAVNAQGIGIKAGVNLANVAEDPSEMDWKMNLGLKLGVVYEAELAESFYFSPGLFFSQKGAKTSFSEVEEGITVDFDMKGIINYLEIPMNFAYKADLGGARLVIEAGPYLAYALGGKYKMEGKAMGISFDVSEDMEFGSEEGQTKRMDFGINAGVGLEFSNIKVGAQYGLGLANLENSDDYSAKNRVIGLSVGYFFGR